MSPKVSRRPQLTVSLLTLLVVVTPQASAQTFTMNENFLRTMFQGETIQPTFRVRIDAHGPLHQLGSDCEMHVAGRMQNVSMGTPSAIVVEFPNWCKFNPQGQLGDSFGTLETLWGNFADANLDNKTCDVKGFLRIFAEHVQGSSGASNPDHAYEFHPAMSITCGSGEFSFESMLTAFPGLRKIQPSSADGCIRTRKLNVRFKNNRYEFQESGGANCGNFELCG